MTSKMPCYATVIFCLSIVGCSILAPRPDRSRFFTLTSMPAAHRAEVQSPQPGTTRPIVYGLGPIRLPAYLDRNEVATRVSPTEVTYSATDRWAAPLAATVSSVLVQILAIRVYLLVVPGEVAAVGSRGDRVAAAQVFSQVAAILIAVADLAAQLAPVPLHVPVVLPKIAPVLPNVLRVLA